MSFTGSVATGRRIGLCAVENLKPTTLELGGKSPLLIFEDAVETEEDLEKAVEWTMVSLDPSQTLAVSHSVTRLQKPSYYPHSATRASGGWPVRQGFLWTDD